MTITWDEDDPKNNYLTVFSWKSSRTKTFIIVSLVNTFATVFTWVNFAFVYVNFTMITTKSSRTFAFETTKCILNTTLWTENFTFWELPLYFKILNRMQKSWKSRCNTKMESKVVLNKPLWYNSVTPPPRIQTTYYVVKAQSTNPDKNLIKEIYEKIEFHEIPKFWLLIPWGVNSRLRTKHWPPFWQGEKALSGSHSFMSK